MRIGRMFHRNAQTYLVHVFGEGLEGDRYVGKRPSVTVDEAA